jgi:UDP-N-acetylglucosamine 2-epimerase
MISEVHQYETLGFLKTMASVPHEDYVNLLRYCEVLIGNSSSGIIEAPVLSKPFINVGTRQRGRERAGNVVDVPYDAISILTAFHHVRSSADFRRRCLETPSPYGGGNTSERIVEILSGKC